MTDLLTDGRRKYYSVSEVKDYLGLSRSKVYQLVESGEIGASKFGGSLRISRDEVLRYEERATLHKVQNGFD